MRLLADSGLWRTGTPADAPPLAVVLEVSGAVLEWTVDDVVAAPSITFTDADRADWLWRVIGEHGHVDVLAAIGAPDQPVFELATVEFDPQAVAALRRLAFGHWLARWWPSSRRAGIPALDPALLVAEIAVLTEVAEPFFADDTFDSSVAELLAPHAALLAGYRDSADPRISELAYTAIELVESHGSDVDVLAAARLGRRDDYALAAGGGPVGDGAVIARGTDSVQWSAVPAAVFDAAEDTITWRIDSIGASVVAEVDVAVLAAGRCGGIPVRLAADGATATGVLDDRGAARLAVVDAADNPLTETVAWNIDWAATTVRIGAPVTDPDGARDRVRRLVRDRLSDPGDDAFLAERLAAESVY